MEISHVDAIPPCSYPHAHFTFAVYDGKTKSGPWAYMCEAHFESNGVGLGLGKGQRLTTEVQEDNPSKNY